MPLTVIEQPSFNPDYVPYVTPEGEVKPDSITIQCFSETENVFTYQAWDQVPRWFGINRPDGTVASHQEFTYGETYVIPNEPGWSVDYYAGGIYNFRIEPGQCSTNSSTTTTTAPPNTTTTAPTESSTTSTIPSLTTTTELVTTTTPTLPLTVAEVQGTVTSLVAQPAPTNPTSVIANTGFDPMFLLFLAALLIAMGSLAVVGAKRVIVNKPLDRTTNKVYADPTRR